MAKNIAPLPNYPDAIRNSTSLNTLVAGNCINECKSLTSREKVYDLFHCEPHGYLENYGKTFPDAGALLDINPRVMVWTPDESSSHWDNDSLPDYSIIRETEHNEKVPGRHFNVMMAENYTRIVFIKKKNSGFYEFVGIYILDYTASIAEYNTAVWRRISKTFEF